MATIVSFAQDVIITIDAQKIEAKIMEVSKSEIKYKELDNLDGPLFTLATSDINTIIYANGKVVLYNQPTQSTQQPTQQEPEQAAVGQSAEQSSSIKRQAFSEPEKKQTNEFIATILLRSGHVIEGEIIEMNNRHVEYYANGSRNTIPASQIESVTLPNGQIKTYNNTSVRESNTSIADNSANTAINNQTENAEIVYKFADYKGQYLPRFTVEKVNVPGKKYKKWRYVGGNMVLTEAEFRKILEMYCPEAYKKRKVATALGITSIIMDFVCLPVGIVLCIVSVSQSSQVLSIYNASCATKPVALNPEDYFEDEVQLARIIIAE